MSEFELTDTQTFSSPIAREMEVRNVVDNFRGRFAKARFSKINSMQEKQSLCDQIHTLIESRNQILILFFKDALEVYPEIECSPDELTSFLKTLSSAHPLVVLFSKYMAKVQEVESNLAIAFAHHQMAQDSEMDAQREEDNIRAQYDNFYCAQDSDIPSVEQLMSEAPQMKSQSAEDIKILSSITGLDLIDPASQALIEASVSRDATDAKAERDAALTIVSEVKEAREVPDNKFLKIIIAIAGLGYVLMGGG